MNELLDPLKNPILVASPFFVMTLLIELAAFKFARQKSKLAGTIRGSYFVIKGEY